MGKKHHRRRNDGNFSFWERWPLQTAVVVTLLWFFLTWMCGDIKLVHVCWVSQKITGADKPSFIDVSDRSCLLSVEFDKRLKLLPASVNWLSDTFVLISYNFLSCMLNLYCLTTPPPPPPPLWYFHSKVRIVVAAEKQSDRLFILDRMFLHSHIVCCLFPQPFNTFYIKDHIREVWEFTGSSLKMLSVLFPRATTDLNKLSLSFFSITGKSLTNWCLNRMVFVSKAHKSLQIASLITTDSTLM